MSGSARMPLSEIHKQSYSIVFVILMAPFQFFIIFISSLNHSLMALKKLIHIKHGAPKKEHLFRALRTDFSLYLLGLSLNEVILKYYHPLFTRSRNSRPHNVLLRNQKVMS